MTGVDVRGLYKETSHTKVRSSVHDGPLFTAYVYRTANSIVLIALKLGQ